MKQQLIFFIAVFFPAVAMAQFSKDVEQSYLLYNKARIFETAGHLDSAAIYMKKSIRLNKNNGQTRDYSWDIFLKSGRYSDAIEDAKDYYTKNTLPESPNDIFYSDPATIAKLKKSKEFKQFVASYDALKKKNRETVKVDDELKQLLKDCMVTDQFVRNCPVGTAKCDTESLMRIWHYADSTNMESVASYFRRKSFPASVELDGVTMTSKFVISFIHYLQDSVEYAKYPSWKYLDSTMLQAVYTGIFPARYYLRFLDNRSVARAKTREDSRQLFGTWSNQGTDPVTKKPVRQYSPEIGDIEHVDERRRKWMQPTLYEESRIDTTIRLPEKYYTN
jgi:tetratricopeptide (TPR) repeat protein